MLLGVGEEKKKPFTLELSFKFCYTGLRLTGFCNSFCRHNKTSKQQLAQKGSGLATEIENTDQCRAFNVPISTAPTSLQINFSSQSHSEPLLDLKIIHNKSPVSSEILQDYSRISLSSLHDFLNDYSSTHFRAFTNPSSPKNSRPLF